MRLTIRFHNRQVVTADLADDFDLVNAEWLRGQWRSGARGSVELTLTNATLGLLYDSITDITIEEVP